MSMKQNPSGGGGGGGAKPAVGVISPGTYSDTGGSSVGTVTPSAGGILLSGVQRLDDIYYKQDFDDTLQEFVIRAKFEFNSVPGSDYAGSWTLFGLTDVDPRWQDMEDDDNGISVSLHRHPTGGGYGIYLKQHVFNSVDSGYLFAVDTPYWLEFERANDGQYYGGSLSVKVYSDATYTTLVDTISKVGLFSRCYRYFGMGGFNIPAATEEIAVTVTDMVVVSNNKSHTGYDEFNSKLTNRAGTLTYNTISGTLNEIVTHVGPNQHTPVASNGILRSLDDNGVKKGYCEFICTTGTPRFFGIGTERFTWNLDSHDYPGKDIYSWGYTAGGQIYHGGGGSAYGDTFVANDVIGIAVDVTNMGTGAGKVWWSKNGVWQASGNPATGANPGVSDIGGTDGSSIMPFCSTYALNEVVKCYMASEEWTYSAPSGFSAFEIP